MNKTGNMNLLGSVFKDLGSDGARLINVMATMADRVDILKKHLLTSRDAFKEGEAVIGEYMIQNQTAAALLERSSNLWAKAFTNPEGVDMVKQLAQAWYDVSKEMTQSEGLMFSLRASIDTISIAIKGLIKLFPYLIKFGISFATIFAGKSIYFGVKSLIQAFRMLWAEIKIANTWGKALEATMSSNWILAAAAALISLVTLLWDYAEAAKEAAEREAEHQRELQKSFAKSKDNIENVVKPLETYKKALDDATLSEKQRMAMVKQFKTDYQDYLDYLGIEIQSAVDLAKAYAQVVKVMKQKKAYEERENYRTEKNGENRMDRIAAQAQVEAAARSLGIEGVNKDFLYNTQHTRRGNQLIARGVNDIYKELMGRKIKGKFTTSARNPWEIFLINEETERIGDVDYGNKTLYDALNTYIKALREEEKVNKEVNQMFNSEYKNIDLEHFDIDEFNDRVQRAQWKRKGSLDNDKPDKEAQRELTKAQQAEKKQLKLEMDQAEKDSTAVINAIEEFYRLQESAVEQLVADGKMTREEANKMIEYVRNRQDEMLMNARRAVAGKDSNFEQLRKTMGNDMLRPGDPNSQRAMNTVQTIDVAEAARRLQKFDGSKGVYDLNAGSFTQAMLKNAAQNELNIQRRQAKVQEEIDKILLQYEYVEQAQRTFGDKLVKLGLITDGYDKVVQQLAEGTEIVANTNDVRALASKVVGMNASRLFGVDTGNATDLARLINYIMTDEQGVRESFAAMFPSLNEWMANPDDYREQMQAFYKALIDMDSDYYKALKQNYEQQKREFTERWQAMGWSATQERQNTVFDTRDSLRKIGGQGLTFGQTYGFADTIADDPEIARIKNRMEWRARELEDLQARNASEELIMQKQNEMLKEAASLAEKVSSEVASRISKVQTLSEPLNAWGEEVGQKLGEVWQGISQDGKLSFGQMARNMGIEYAKLTLKMATENLMKQVQQGLFYKQMEMQAMAHETTLNAIQASGDAARIAAKQATGAALAGIQAAQNTTEISQEGAKAGVMTAFGISSGAAKTIAQLGWWGIPLIGVISSILMGLLNSAKATAGQSSSSSSSTNDAQKLKLVSNMLTYDEGNVGTYAGTDGHVYRAANNPAPGTGLITHPIATTVQGNPALVAERGPEIVIGRRATANIMRWNPALLNVLASYDPHSRRRTYDDGTPVASAAMPSQPTSAEGQDPRMEATLAALSQTVALLSATVSDLQKKGIRAFIDKYGAGGLVEEVKSGLKFDKKYGR